MSTQKNVIAVAMAVLLVAVAATAYWFGARHGSPSAAANGAPAAAAERKPLYWHDPMSPGQKFDKPGKSPFMDMQLVPVYADDGTAGGTEAGAVTVSPRMQQNLGLRTADVTLGTLAPTLSAVGNVAYSERELVLVQARANGFVERLFVRNPFESVSKGQPLLEMLVPDWVAAQEEFLAVQRMPGSATDGMQDGARQRMRLAGMPDELIRKLAQQGKVQTRMTITAPAAGVIAEQGAREGMTVAPGAALFRINGLDTVWVNAELAENAVAQIRPGMPVDARSAALPGTIFKGQVDAILPEVSGATRTVKVRIALANPGRHLLPGMFANVSFKLANSPAVLLVPSEAVIQTGTRSVVMRMDGAGKFAAVEVETGAEVNGQTEIRKGLAAGQKVVVSGQFLVDSEANLKASSHRMEDSAPGAGK
jgi:Cu(I)/Ag(I) efflux system membrane fusion protein